jgi:hypothetical protein
MTATNPFFDISLLPYQAPHFDEINDITIARPSMKRFARSGRT